MNLGIVFSFRISQLLKTLVTTRALRHEFLLQFMNSIVFGGTTRAQWHEWISEITVLAEFFQPVVLVRTTRANWHGFIT